MLLEGINEANMSGNAKIRSNVNRRVFADTERLAKPPPNGTMSQETNPITARVIETPNLRHMQRYVNEFITHHGIRNRILLAKHSAVAE